MKAAGSATKQSLFLPNVRFVMRSLRRSPPRDDDGFGKGDRGTEGEGDMVTYIKYTIGV